MENKCFICYSATLKSHRLTHSGERPFQCSVCSSRFSQRASLAKHMKTHNTVPKLECSYCGNELKDKESLNRHIKMVHVNCQFCNECFCSNKKLEAHVLKVHRDEDPPYKCTECPSTFVAKLNYRKHMKTIHRKVDLVCEECGARFKRTDRFNNHKKIHVAVGKEKLNECTICHATFNHKNSLSKHLSFHMKFDNAEDSACDSI